MPVHVDNSYMYGGPTTLQRQFIPPTLHRRVVHAAPALYQKSDLYIPRNESALASLFPKQNYNVLSPNFHIHVSVSNLYVPSIGLPIWLQQNRQTDPVNI
jgi:hypothetical protein